MNEAWNEAKYLMKNYGDRGGCYPTVMQTLDFVSGLHNCLEFSQPLLCLYRAMQTRETFSIAEIAKSDILRFLNRKVKYLAIYKLQS